MTTSTRSAFFSESLDTDLTLVDRDYSISQAILMRWREQGKRPRYTLKEGKTVERKNNISPNLSGEFQYVVYRNEVGEIDINIGHGAHYLIGSITSF